MCILKKIRLETQHWEDIEGKENLTNTLLSYLIRRSGRLVNRQCCSNHIIIRNNTFSIFIGFKTNFTLNVCVSAGFAGTPGYLSPEVLRKDPYGKPVDIWACGQFTRFYHFSLFIHIHWYLFRKLLSCNLILFFLNNRLVVAFKTSQKIVLKCLVFTTTQISSVYCRRGIKNPEIFRI